MSMDATRGSTFSSSPEHIAGELEDRAPALSAPTEPLHRLEGVAVFLITFALGIAVASVLVFHYGIVFGDALSRTLSGFYTVFRGTFHLADVGFLWNPLPSLLSIPFALVRGLWPPLIEYGFAGNIISAGFLAVGVYHLNRILYRMEFRPVVRWLWCLGYLANPLLLFYGANGMTDGMLVGAVVASLDGLLEYAQKRRLVSLVRAGVWLALGFMLRYESVPIGIFMGIGLVMGMYLSGHLWSRIQGAVVALWFPIFCAGVTWILLNWMIMHNPLYFALSRYGNASQISTGTYNTAWIIAAKHHVVVDLYQVAHFTSNFWPFIPVFIAAGLLQFRKPRDSFGMPLMLASLGAPVLQLLLLYTNRTADWQRFFIYYIPFGTVLFAYVLWKLFGRRSTVPALLGVVVIFSAAYVCLHESTQHIWGHGDRPAFLTIEQRPVSAGQSFASTSIQYKNVSHLIAHSETIAGYINDHPGLRVVLSSFTSYGVIPFIKHPNQIVFTEDQDYRAVLLNPRGRVNAILIDPPSALSKTEYMYQVYPTLWSGDLPWTRLIKQFSGGVRLYAILRNAP